MKPLSHKTLFLIDATGALLSCFLLGFVLVKYQSYFGIPQQTLYTLAIFPFGFFLYDLYCLIFVKSLLYKYLKPIAYFNIIYCLISLVLVVAHMKDITLLGWLYICVEIIIVLMLAKIELNASSLSN
ncbi:conserved membrane hypothetical protein [Tenacibaculum sp. 190130A14a]|uniref:Uncharacterized protein n=1 Tax=Tenacibaculum polynesiense TaxID=3137857 RepID=A0ABM9PFD1_9FLAO